MNKTFLILIFSLLIAGCGDTSVVNVNLGSVSIGQQLIDLKSAKDVGAITESEYDAAKFDMLQVTKLLPQGEAGLPSDE